MNYRGSVAIIAPSMKPPIRTLLTTVLALATLPTIGKQTTPTHTFTIEGDHFALDGEPFKVLSGELHYSRIPREFARVHVVPMMELADPKRAEQHIRDILAIA